ncbi:hypothetical protein AB0K43_29110 [Kitasatospora sp. NPDC049258]|uniref:hypothetical protein n=1 Tax=Kitasatospora sp. NPDC049258 TaxID=3155394 RepID=UPI00343E4095
MSSPAPHRPAVTLTVLRPDQHPAPAAAPAPPAGPGRLLLAVADAGLAFALLLPLWELGECGYRLLCG